MKKFFADKSKIFFMIFLVLGFILLISCAAYATEYTNIHIFYQISSSGEVIFSREYANDTLSSWNNQYLYDGFEKMGTPMTNEIARTIYNFQKNMSSVNSFIVIVGAITLIAIAVMFIFSNHNRKVYYKSNLIVGIVCPAIVIILLIVLLVRNFLVMEEFNANFDLFNKTSILQNTYKQIVAAQMTDISHLYECTSSTFIAFAVLFIIVLVYSAFMIFVTVIKYIDSTERRNQILERAAINND